MITKITIADIATIFNALCGLTAIFLTFSGYTPLIPVLILIAVIFDGADGYLARKFGSNKSGAILDSLADTVSFGVAPVVILFSIYPPHPLFILGLYSLLACSILRLARFGVAKKSDSFEGLPITIGAMMPLSLVLIDTYHNYVEAMGLLLIILSLLMISSIPYPKTRSRKTIIFGLTVLVIVVIGNLADIYALTVSLFLFLTLVFYLLHPLLVYLKPKK